MIKHLVFLLSFSMLLTSSAEAYIDPDIISIFLQGIVAAFVGIFTYITLYWQKFKDLLKKSFQTDRQKK